MVHDVSVLVCMYKYSYDMYILHTEYICMYVRSTIQYSTTLVLDYVAVRQSIMYDMI